jgi:hypothetical protein
LANFDEEGAAISNAKRYIKRLTAMSSPEDYYRYETINGVSESGTSVHNDPADVQRKLEEGLDSSPEQSTAPVSGALESRLEDLGYL